MKRNRYWLFLIIVIVFIYSQCKNSSAVPEEIIGRWKTASHKYKDTYFELEKNRIIILDLKGSFDINFITKIKRKKTNNDDWVFFNIFYQNADMKKIEFPFYYNPVDNGLIRFKNQPSLVWTRQTNF